MCMHNALCASSIGSPCPVAGAAPRPTNCLSRVNLSVPDGPTQVPSSGWLKRSKPGVSRPGVLQAPMRTAVHDGNVSQLDITLSRGNENRDVPRKPMGRFRTPLSAHAPLENYRLHMAPLHARRSTALAVNRLKSLIGHVHNAPRRWIDDHAPVVHDGVLMPACSGHLPDEFVRKRMKLGRVGKSSADLHFEIGVTRRGETMTVGVLVEHLAVRRREGERAVVGGGVVIVMLSNGRSDAGICTNEQG